MFGMKILRRNRVHWLRMFVAFATCCITFLMIKKLLFLHEGDVDDMSSIRYNDEEHNMLGKDDLKSFKKAGEISGKKTVWPVPPHHEKLSKRVKKERHSETAAKVEMVPQIEPKPFPVIKDNPFDIKKAAATIKKLNNDQRILNVEKFPTRTEKSIVIVVQVHKRANYLRKLIESLRVSKGISDALLIFSHDYISSEIDKLVQSIDFCQVLQIYFPYSEQLHPVEFPGTDPKDCPRDQRIAGCNNEHHPDMYGHYREAKFTMTKHHWWWKANRVFRDLHATRDHQGLVLFLEEDHYVAPDFYHVLRKAYAAKDGHRKHCDIITLGDYKALFEYQEEKSNTAKIRLWKSTEHNMGMAFDRRTWKKITKCSEMFCTYDDYNWDWTLMKMSSMCLNEPFTVLLIDQPRVFHLGSCGLHHNAGSCDVEQAVSKVNTLIRTGAKFLYPQKLAITVAKSWIGVSVGQPNGGWGDIRDHELCLKFTTSAK